MADAGETNRLFGCAESFERPDDSGFRGAASIRRGGIAHEAMEGFHQRGAQVVQLEIGDELGGLGYNLIGFVG